MNNEKILLIFVVVVSLSLFLTNTSRGLQTEDKITDTEIEMKIENDGTYELKSNVSLENMPTEMIMVENLDLQTNIENIEEDKIRIKTDSKIEFDNILGLFLLNESLKSAIPGDISDYIPQNLRGLIGGIIDLEKLDKNPVRILNLMNSSFVISAVNSNFLSKLEGKTVENLLKEYNLEGDIPPSLKNYIPNAKIEEIKITNYNWKEPILNIGLNIELSEGTENIQKFMKAIPLKIDLSYLSSYLLSEESINNLEAEVDIGVDSKATLPGYKKGEIWSIKPPSEVNQMLEDIGIWEREGGVNFKLKTPETAEVHNLPKNYEKLDDNTYQWSGKDGKKAIRSIMENESLEIELEEESGGISPKNPLLWVGIFAIIAIIALIAIITIRK